MHLSLKAQQNRNKNRKEIKQSTNRVELQMYCFINDGRYEQKSWFEDIIQFINFIIAMWGNNWGKSSHQATHKSKKYFKDNKLTGLYQQIDPLTAKLKQQGNFQNGLPSGKWRTIDQDGDQIHYQYTMQRTGAICNDGTSSGATGRGACSWHGGVRQWVYDAVRSQVGGTGKYLPIQTRILELKKKIKQLFRIDLGGQQFEQHILKLIIAISQQKCEIQQILSQKEDEMVILDNQNGEICAENAQLMQKNKQLVAKEAQSKQQIENLKAKVALLQKQNEGFKRQPISQITNIASSSQQQPPSQAKHPHFQTRQLPQQLKPSQQQRKVAEKKAQTDSNKEEETDSNKEQANIQECEQQKAQRRKPSDKKQGKLLSQTPQSYHLSPLQQKDNSLKQKRAIQYHTFREEKLQSNGDQIDQLQSDRIQKRARILRNVDVSKQQQRARMTQKKQEQDEKDWEDYGFNSDDLNSDEQNGLNEENGPEDVAQEHQEKQRQQQSLAQDSEQQDEQSGGQTKTTIQKLIAQMSGMNLQ